MNTTNEERLKLMEAVATHPIVNAAAGNTDRYRSVTFRYDHNYQRCGPPLKVRIFPGGNMRESFTGESVEEVLKKIETYDPLTVKKEQIDKLKAELAALEGK